MTGSPSPNNREVRDWVTLGDRLVVPPPAVRNTGGQVRDSPNSTGGQVRCKLFVEGGTAGQSGKVILSREEILQVLDNGGKIGCGEALRLRIRYFRDGLVLGSEGFVNEIFAQFRDHFGSKRKTGARKLRRLPFEGLRTMRDLRKKVLS